VTAPPRLLVVAATDREVVAGHGWDALRCGVGPVEAAARTAAHLATHRPSAVLHVGIAGARRARALPPATLVLGASAVYCDLGVPERFAPRTVEGDPGLLAALRAAWPDAPVLAIGTSGRVGGTSGCDVEAMEGFAVLRAAQLAGVPAIEVRTIANDIEEADRARWHLDAAFAAITAATPRLVAALAACVR
jgi:nucleoside phosphorylase